MDNIFIQLAIILSLSSILGFFTKRLNIPLLIAYLLGGLVLSITAFIDVTKSSALTFLPDIGIAFVLFLVGMELDLREIRSFGRQILIAGILQVIISSTLGTFIAQSFNFPLRESILLGIGLSFSSTILVVKILLDKNNLSSLYGKLSLGVLLLEDLLAVLILLAMTSSNSILNLGLSATLPLLSFGLKVILLFGLTVILSHFVLPVIFRAVSEVGELLFLSSLAWCFAFITLAQMMGFSVMIGAFLAGVALASSPYHFQIQGKVKPMRDFFTTLFFVYLGTRVDFGQILPNLPVILIFSAYAVVIKPLIFLVLFGMFGFRKHTMFHTAVNLSQVSEFSLIILLIGLKMGLTSPGALTVIAFSSLLSMIASSLMISNARKLYQLILSLVAFFERKTQLALPNTSGEEFKDHVVLIGSHQVGEEVILYLQKEKVPLMVLDYNPYQVEILAKKNIPVIFGDMGDVEVLEALGLENCRLVISTVPDVDDNKLLIEDLRSRSAHIPIIVRSDSIKDAKSLYKFGASFVYVPDIVSGEFLVEMLKNHLGNSEYFKERPKIEQDKLASKKLAWE